MTDLFNLDVGATTPVAESVYEAMKNAPQGNANSIHKLGQDAKLFQLKAEEFIKEYLLADSSSKLLFYSSGSAANIAAVKLLSRSWGRKYFTSNTEHRSIASTNPSGYHVKVSERGDFDDHDLRKVIANLSIILCNNETGIVTPLKHIRSNCRNLYYMHSDAVHALGRIPINLSNLPIDLLTLSAHKIGGPKGIACLWIRENTFTENSINYNAPGLSEGTMPIPLIAGFVQAIKDLGPIDKRREKLELQEIAFLAELGKEVDYKLNVPVSTRVPGTISIQFPKVDAVSLMLELSNKVLVSTGSACNLATPSEVLLGMGFSKEEVASTIRVTLDQNMPIDQVKEAASIIADAVKSRS